MSPSLGKFEKKKICIHFNSTLFFTLKKSRFPGIKKKVLLHLQVKVSNTSWEAAHLDCPGETQPAFLAILLILAGMDRRRGLPTTLRPTFWSPRTPVWSYRTVKPQIFIEPILPKVRVHFRMYDFDRGKKSLTLSLSTNSYKMQAFFFSFGKTDFNKFLVYIHLVNHICICFLVYFSFLTHMYSFTYSCINLVIFYSQSLTHFILYHSFMYSHTHSFSVFTLWFSNSCTFFTHPWTNVFIHLKCTHRHTHNLHASFFAIPTGRDWQYTMSLPKALNYTHTSEILQVQFQTMAIKCILQ